MIAVGRSHKLELFAAPAYVRIQKRSIICILRIKTEPFARDTVLPCQQSAFHALSPAAFHIR